MRKTKRPPIGTTIWSVHEHLYYIQNHAGPVIEYVVLPTTVTGIFVGGYVEICSKGKNPDGYMTPYRFKLSDLGKNVFYTSREAAELAKKATEDYERTWSWTKDPPLRRTWEHYLNE